MALEDPDRKRELSVSLIFRTNNSFWSWLIHRYPASPPLWSLLLLKPSMSLLSRNSLKNTISLRKQIRSLRVTIRWAQVLQKPGWVMESLAGPMIFSLAAVLLEADQAWQLWQLLVSIFVSTLFKGFIPQSPSEDNDQKQTHDNEQPLQKPWKQQPGKDLGLYISPKGPWVCSSALCSTIREKAYHASYGVEPRFSNLLYQNRVVFAAI
jgi:hypothetical protein